MWWRVLGVSRDADLNTVKKAYSELIKQYRPEDHPEEFSQIRHAFEEARKQAPKKSVPLVEYENDLSQIATQPYEPELWKPASNFDFSEAPQITITETEEISTTESVQVISENINTVIEPDQASEISVLQLLEEWKDTKFQKSECIDAILNHSSTRDYFELINSGNEIFSWLIDNVKIAPGFLSTKINVPLSELAKMDKLFGWSLHERELYTRHQNKDLSLIFFGIAAAQGKEHYKNTIILDKVKKQTKENKKAFTKIIEFSSGFVLISTLIFIIGFTISNYRDQKYWAVVLCVLLFVFLVDGLKYSFAGSTRIGIFKNENAIIKFYLSTAIRSLILLSAITILEILVIAILIGSFQGIMHDGNMNPVAIISSLGFSWLTYWFNRESFYFIKNNVLQFMGDRIVLVSKYKE